MAPDELLTHVILPAPGNVKSGHYEALGTKWSDPNKRSGFFGKFSF